MKISLFTLLILMCCHVNSQSFHIKSYEAGFGIYQDQKNLITRGHSMTFQVSTSFNQNIISLGIFGGVGTVDSDQSRKIMHVYAELSAMYSREYRFDNWVLEPQIGVGIMNQTRLFESERNAFSIPIRVKFQYKISDRFGIGIAPGASINKNNTIFYLPLFIQY